MVAEHEVRLPTIMEVSKKVRKGLNMNIYRNLHHHSLNTQKQNFHADVKHLVENLPKAAKIWIHYQIFAPTKGRLDTMNVGSIVDKYFSDTLVEAGMIEDDDYTRVVFNSFSFGGVRKMDGHAIATIHILEEETPMRIFLDDAEIKAAIENYVGENISVPVQDLIFSSNDEGLTVEIVTGPGVPDEQQPEEKPKPKRRSPHKRKPAAKPEPEAEEVKDEPTETSGKGSGDTADTAETERAADTPEDGEKAAKTTGNAKKGNLFGDEDDQSSASAETTTDSPADEETPDAEPVKKAKKSSIFDVS